MNERLPVDPHRDLTTRLRRVDLLLLRAVQRQRARPAVHQKGQYWGQFITDDEVDALLRAQGEIDLPVDAGLASLEDELVRSLAWRDRPADGARLPALRAAFGLDGDDVDLLLLALAPEISAGYGKLFAYLADDLQKPYLTVDLATRILRTERTERLGLADRLLPDAPLVRQRLAILTPDPGRTPQSARRILLPGRLLQWLLGHAGEGYDLGATPLDLSGEPFVPQACKARVDGLTESLPRARPGLPTPAHPVTVAILGGTPGMREGVAMAVARGAGRPLVRVEVDRLKGYLDAPYDLVRDLRVRGAVPYVVGIPDFTEEPDQREKMMRLGTALATLPYPLCVGGRDRRTLSIMLGGDRPRIDLPVGRTTIDERKAAWERALRVRGWSGLDVEALAVRFSAIGGTTIDRVLTTAGTEAGPQGPTDAQVQAACREAARPQLSGLVQHVIPRYAWSDLILPDGVFSQLRHLETILAHQENVMQRWGQQRLRPRGFGIKALFCGHPGTGKTMCAEVLAGALGYDLYKVDLSSMVSKWVGETEKNLKQVFDQAEGGTSVLLFDEGDVLFGSRGETKSAQDKYANQEVAYLLQRLEVFEGCAVITTNLLENIDDAFLRRFTAVVEFPFPGAQERTLLWTRALPEDPRFHGDDLDPAVLGRQFDKLAGGNIVNAILDACVLASADDAPLGMAHCVVAVAREYYKIGEPINLVNFGPWLPVAKAAVPHA